MPNIKIEIHAFKIGLFMALGWEAGVCLSDLIEKALFSNQKDSAKEEKEEA